MNKKINRTNGTTFGWTTMLFGVVIFPLILIALFEYLVMSYIEPSESIFYIGFLVLMFLMVFLFALFVFTSIQGVQFMPIERKFRLYTSFLGLKFGEWFSLDFYSFISVIRSSKSGRVGRVTTFAVTDISYQLIFMDKSHRTKKVVKLFNSFSEAKKYAEMLSTKIQIPLVKYSPKRISKKR